MAKVKSKTFAESVNWEYVHAHHKVSDGKVTPAQHPTWIARIIESARRNGFTGKISLAGAARIINQNLY
jgi:hypothetical protein